MLRNWWWYYFLALGCLCIVVWILAIGLVVLLDEIERKLRHYSKGMMGLNSKPLR